MDVVDGRKLRVPELNIADQEGFIQLPILGACFKNPGNNVATSPSASYG